MGFSCWGAIFMTIPACGVCWFVIDDLRQELARRLQMVTSVPENVGRHPYNPERDSNDKDHRAAKREVHNQNRMSNPG